MGVAGRREEEKERVEVARAAGMGWLVMEVGLEAEMELETGASLAGGDVVVTASMAARVERARVARAERAKAARAARARAELARAARAERALAARVERAMATTE